MDRNDCYVGQQVYFSRSNGQKTLGTITKVNRVKVNRVKVKVAQDEQRGTYRSHKVGTVWTVPPALCWPVDEGKPAYQTRTRQTRPSVPGFRLGQVVSTPGALALLSNIGHSPSQYLRRHLGGDWGDLDAEDKAANDKALANDARLLSAYETPAGKVWIITEWDRSATTTLLLPSEY